MYLVGARRRPIKLKVFAETSLLQVFCLSVPDASMGNQFECHLSESRLIMGIIIISWLPIIGRKSKSSQSMEGQEFVD